ncbi:MAG: hypothetical protein EKK33_07800 [Bradyrhizobiaceae bacterium]|nr:MAG: hypothetical protein EKK33_07800 [Bradyrhizobiaceae bacterium]
MSCGRMRRRRGELVRCSRHRHCEELLRRSNPDCLRGRILDCFAEPVIGPRVARARWLAMTELSARTSC